MENEIKIFLNLANKNTYANKAAQKADSTRLNSEDYHFENGEWIYHDTYWTRPEDFTFIGNEIIYKNKKHIWGANYWGVISDRNQSIKEVYGFLREAMMQEYELEVPVRGPEIYENGEWKYTFQFTGNLENFEGVERIYRNGIEIYKLIINGGILI